MQSLILLNLGLASMPGAIVYPRGPGLDTPEREKCIRPSMFPVKTRCVVPFVCAGNARLVGRGSTRLLWRHSPRPSLFRVCEALPRATQCILPP